MIIKPLSAIRDVSDLRVSPGSEVFVNSGLLVEAYCLWGRSTWGALFYLGDRDIAATAAAFCFDVWSAVLGYCFHWVCHHAQSTSIRCHQVLLTCSALVSPAIFHVHLSCLCLRIVSFLLRSSTTDVLLAQIKLCMVA